MPTIDSTAKAALGNQVLQPIYFGFVDFLGAPVFATTAAQNVSFSGTGDTDLDGKTYQPVGGMVSVGDVTNSEGGSGELIITLSGILGIDTATLNLIGDRSKWYRRRARLWMVVNDENGSQQGAIIAFKSGWMTGARIVPSPTDQTIEITVETFKAIWADASNRSYSMQAEYDSGDTSAGATVGAANGIGTGPGGGISGGYGLPGGGLSEQWFAAQ